MGLKEIEDKLGWLHHHFQIFDAAVSEFVNRQNIHFAPKRYNEAKTEVWGHLESTLDRNALTVVSHMFGDVLQTANSCLDYLVCELFLRYNPEEEPKLSHKFPITHNRGSFNQAIGGDALYGIPFDVVAVIESLQPYEGRTDPMPFDLNALRSLANSHKHRRLHIAALTACPAPSDPANFIEKNGEFFVSAKDMPKPIHFNAELGPFPVMEDGQMNMDYKFAPVIVLKEKGFREEPINILTARLCASLGSSLQKFRPFFE
jgi:hypothetical protein